MQAPIEWAIRAAVIAVPWAHPERGNSYDFLFEAIINANTGGQELGQWIVLEDGHMLNPRQIAELKGSIESGSLALPLGFLDF